MPTIDLSDLDLYDRRNLWQPDPATIEVRPGLRSCWSAQTNHEILAGRTVQSPTSGETFHYTIEARIDATSPGVRFTCYDEYGNVLHYLEQDGALFSKAATISALGQEVILGGKGIPTARAIVGGHIALAEKVASSNAANTTAIDVPRGINIAWKNRMLIAAGPTQDAAGGIVVSDVGKPQTYVVQNFLSGPWVAPIKGWAVAAEGVLIVATESGLWAIPDGVVGAGQRIAPEVISQLSSLSTYDYNQLCVARGTVFALTRKSIRQVYPPGPDLLLDEQRCRRTVSARISSSDYRAGGRLVGTDVGPMLSFEGKLFVYDMSTGHRGWWDFPNKTSFSLVGVMNDSDGDELLVASDGVYRLEGNMDGGLTTSSEGGAAVEGYFSGIIPNTPGGDWNAVEVRTKAAGPGNSFAHIGASSNNAKAIPQRGFLEGVGSWADNATGDSVPEELAQMVRHTIPRTSEQNELSLEVGATVPGTRLMPAVEVDMGGSDPTGSHQKSNST